MKTQFTFDEAVMKSPLGEINGFKYRPGYRRINGASIVKEGVNFTIYSNNATNCELLLYKIGEKEPYAVIPFPDDCKMGGVFSMIIYDLKIGEFEYAYRMDGPYDPEKGLIFNKEKVLLDPYAEIVTGQGEWGESQKDKYTYHGSLTRNTFNWENSRNPKHKEEDTIIYELHVRGFTNNPNSNVKYPGTFAGLEEKIPYLKELGVTAIELMPIFEFDEVSEARDYNGTKLLNYWGYNTLNFFSPKASYTAVDDFTQEGIELKKLIKTCHDNDIEVILDVVFNHTSEGNEDGPFFSFKGIDNSVYYMLTPDGHYYNFSGCGNTFNCNNPVVRNFILECLRHWVSVYHVDGFRFDLASILGRKEDGSPSDNAPLLEELAYDPLLKDVKLIAEAWDAGGMYQVGSFPSYNRWMQWNGKYRDDMRSFLKGDFWAAPGAAQRLSGSFDLYNQYPTGSNTSINFLNCHDGFTLYDLYAYNEKHNEANGWDNTDGSDDNRSWNCGVEGETEDQEVNELRLKMIKNGLTALMSSRGIPMFYSGDEFGNTQFGNNNTYCQDSEISWLDWDNLEKNKELFEFTKKIIQFRKDHPVISRDLELSDSGLPRVGVFDKELSDDITTETTFLGILYSGKDNNKEDFVYIGFNPNWEEEHIELPPLPEEYTWKLIMDSELKNSFDIPKDREIIEENSILVSPRSSFILVARKIGEE